MVHLYPESMKSSRIQLDHSYIQYIRILVQCLIRPQKHPLMVGGTHYPEMKAAFSYKAAHHRYLVLGFYEINLKFNAIQATHKSKYDSS